MEKLNKTLKNNEKAITLIALVITIIVLLILAGISISMLSGDNGILQQTTNARTRTIHANVLEQMQLEASAYTVDKTAGVYSNSLIDYLKSKSIISDISGEEEKWLINVTTLLGSNQSTGNGTYPNDVYVLEKQDTSTGNIVNTRVATTMPIRIAATTASQITYNVKYYGNNASENLALGKLVDNNDSSQSVKQYGIQDNGTFITPPGNNPTDGQIYEEFYDWGENNGNHEYSILYSNFFYVYNENGEFLRSEQAIL